jgi:deazaflavin-dependent oxidoreductase (nitroreductase family)
VKRSLRDAEASLTNTTRREAVLTCDGSVRVQLLPHRPNDIVKCDDTVSMPGVAVMVLYASSFIFQLKAR